MYHKKVIAHSGYFHIVKFRTAYIIWNMEGNYDLDLNSPNSRELSASPNVL